MNPAVRAEIRPRVTVPTIRSMGISWLLSSWTAILLMSGSSSSSTAGSGSFPRAVSFACSFWPSFRAARYSSLTVRFIYAYLFFKSPYSIKPFAKMQDQNR